MSGSGGVSGGSANYNIPIIVPLGRNSMQPNVQLSYSSSQGNGLVGVGWLLSSGAAISRCGMTVATDGVSKSVQYSVANDKLCLNGQRLVTAFSYGQSGAEYRTELDSFARIKQYGGNINSTATYFIVEHKNGLVETYGGTADAKHSAYGRTETLTWSISKKEDRANHNIKYSYYQPQVNSGEHLLQYIKYTGHNGSDGNRLITYNYENRSKFSSSYLVGGLSRQTKRLSSISTKLNGTFVRKYILTYDAESKASGRSLLRKIQECGYNSGRSKCLPATTFEWQEKAPEYVLEPLQYSENGSKHIISTEKRWISDVMPVGDTNGDGVRDWPNVYVNAEGEKVGNHAHQVGNCFAMAYSYEARCLDADFNSDGLSDSFIKNNNQLQIKYANTNTWINTGILWNDRFGRDQILGFSDFNSDGYIDIAFNHYVDTSSSDTSSVEVYFHSKNNSSPYTSSHSKIVTSSSLTSGSSNVLPSFQLQGDMDGNGTPDIVSFGRGVRDAPVSVPKHMYLIFPTGTTATVTARSFTNHINSAEYTGGFFHDINGDGLIDWLSMSESSASLKYRLNTGGHFTTSWTSLGFSMPTVAGGVYYPFNPSEPESFYIPDMAKITIMDYDGNGIQDLLVSSSIVASGCTYVTGNGGGWRCDGDINSLYVLPNGGLGAVKGINTTLRDDSVSNFNVMYIDENIAGNFVVRSETTDIVASATQRAILDVTGDGLPDLVTVFGCRFTACEWNTETSNRGGTVQDLSLQSGAYINRNLGSASGVGKDKYAAQDVLKAVRNGLGKRDEWVYKPLSSNAYDAKNGNNNVISRYYETDHNATANDNNYFHFASSMNVVAEHKASNGIGGKNSTKYRYRGAMYNNKGRGFQGFQSIIVEQNNFANDENEAHRDTISRTDFEQKWPLTGMMQQSCTWLASNVTLTDNENCSNVISKTVTNSVINRATMAGARFVAIDASTSTQYDVESKLELSRKTVNKSFDDYGNSTLLSQSNTDCFGTFSNSTTTVFTVDQNSWWLNKFSRITTTQSVSGRQATTTESGSVFNKVTTVVPNTWHAALRKPRKITTSGDGVNFSVETIYNSYGLPNAITRSGEVIEGVNDTQRTQLRTTNFTYTNLGDSPSSDGYFPYTVSSSSGTTSLTTTTKYSPYNCQPTRITNADGTVTVNIYDNFGRLESSKQTGFPTKYLRYYANDSHAPVHSAYRVASISAGSPLQNVYVDMFGRRLRIAVTSFNNDVIYQDKYFDRVGMTTVEYGPHLSMSTDKPTVSYYDYDALGRPQSKSTLQENGSTLLATYEYDGLKTNITANGLVMSRTYNSLNMLVSTTDAKTGVTNYAYDAAKNPVTIADAKGSKIKARYDALGHKLYVNDPNQGITTFSYNDFGEIEKEVDANNDIIRYDMDLLGRVIKRHDYGKVNGAGYKSNVTASFTWDTVKKRLLTSEEVPGSKKSYQYDSAARLTVTTSQLDSYTYQTTAYYDANYGRPTGIKYPNGLLVAYDYKANGYLDKEYNLVSGYIYKQVTAQDAFGNITSALINNANTESTNLYSQISSQMLSTKARVNGQLIHDITYDRFDSFGNIVEQNNNIHHSKEVFEYDDLYRLTASTKTIGTTSLTINYGYDAVGNITKKSDYANNYYYNQASNAGPNAVTSATKINGGGTVTFAYDNKGNLVTSDGKTLNYNVHNKPTYIAKGTVSSKLYYGSSMGRYKQVVVNGRYSNRTTYYVDKLFEVEIYNDKVKWRAYIGDTAIVSHDDIDQHKIHFTHRDRLGSATTFTDHNGAVTAYRGYDPFGKPLGGDWSNLMPATLVNNPYDSDMPTYRGFTDHEHLDEVELIHMNGRVYDYNLGRFLSVDPFIQEPGNSQSTNPYSYIMNNPLSGTDPTGYVAKEETMTGSRIPGVDTGASGAGWGMKSGDLSGDTPAQKKQDAISQGITSAGKQASYNGFKSGQGAKNNSSNSTTEINSQKETSQSDGNYASSGNMPADSRSEQIGSHSMGAGMIDGQRYNITATYGIKDSDSNLNPLMAGITGVAGGLVEHSRVQHVLNLSSKGGHWLSSLYGLANTWELKFSANKMNKGFNLASLTSMGKGLGVLGFAGSSYHSGKVLTSMRSSNAEKAKSAVDIAFGAVGFMGLPGFAISASYFALDYYAQKQGGWGNLLNNIGNRAMSRRRQIREKM
jgi:RHS repeat-associated protein